MIRVSSSAKLVALVGLALILSSGGLSAQVKEPFTPQRFAELQNDGALILIDIFADWCPTCAEQQKILARYQSEYKAVPLHILEVNFDEQKEYVRQFAAPRQSTFVLYHGTKRLWFSVAETRPEVIFAELNKGAAALREER
jgi:thioredoxin 1